MCHDCNLLRCSCTSTCTQGLMCCLQLSAVYCGAHFTYAFRPWCRAPVVLPQWLSQSATPPAGSPIASQLDSTGHASHHPVILFSRLQNWDAVQVPAEQASPVPAAHCHTNAPQNPLLVHMQLWPLILSTLPCPTPTCLYGIASRRVCAKRSSAWAVYIHVREIAQVLLAVSRRREGGGR